MMKLLLPGLALVAMLAGCTGGGLEKKVLGKWTVDMAKTEMTGPKVKDEKDKLFMTELLKTVTITLKEDKRFDMDFLMILNGSWAVDGSKVILTPDPPSTSGTSKSSLTFAGGKKTMDFEVNSTGTEMTFAVDTPEMKGKLVMVKPATP